MCHALKVVYDGLESVQGVQSTVGAVPGVSGRACQCATERTARSTRSTRARRSALGEKVTLYAEVFALTCAARGRVRRKGDVARVPKIYRRIVVLIDI